MTIHDLTNTLADCAVSLECLADVVGTIRDGLPRLPADAGDAVHRLLNCLNTERLADFIEVANTALTACESAEGK